MEKGRRLILCLTLALAMLAGTWGCSGSPSDAESPEPSSGSTQTQAGTGQETSPVAAEPQMRTVVDVAGRTVEIPTQPKRIATMPGPTYEMVFAMGGKDQIGLVRDDHRTVYPLALLTNPDLEGYQAITGVGPKTPVNIEEFLRLDPDLVLYYNIPQELEKFDTAGIPAIVPNWSTTEPQNMEETIADRKQQLEFVADVLGGDAPDRFNRWSDYLDEKVAFIQSRTSEIPASEVPVVYWGNSWGTNILATWGAPGTHRFIVQLCGGDCAGVSGPGKFPEITREQLLGWSPDVIIVDSHGHQPEDIIEELKTSPEWAALPAVKNGRLYRIPSGVFHLDKGTTCVVYYLWLAKQLHPDLFQDVDMVKEMQDYFRDFYDYEMSPEEAEKALSGWIEE